MSVLAIIPARGGSRGVPRKNLQNVGDRSLLARAIQVVREAAVADHILVSTDDPEIRDAAVAAGVPVPFLRDPALAGDTTSTVETVLGVLEQWIAETGSTPDTILLAEPTSPFRRAETLKAGLERYQRGDVRSVIPVCPLERKPQYIYAKSEQRLQPYIEAPRERFDRRQDMEHLCRHAGSFWLVGTEDFRTSRSFVIEPVGYVEADAIEAINIDAPLDLEFANVIAARHNL